MENNETIEKLKQLEQQKNDLQADLRRLKRKPEGKIGYLLLFLGLVLLVLAVVYSHNVSAFIGVALTFWGALLFYIRPTRFIRKEILDSTVVEPLKYVYKILDELEFRGKPRYISPGTLRGIRSASVYIPKSDPFPTLSDEELSHEEAFLTNPSAVKVTPPGLGLSWLLEDELKTNFSTVDLGYLPHNLEKALVEGLEIAETFEIEVSGPIVQVEIRGSIFDEINEELEKFDAQLRIGDPLTSAIACILARSTRRPIIIEKIERESKQRLTRINFKIEDSND